ncbi:bifunctional lytic transglycosylase/C40 family peptidase [Frankia sp. Mgl5]|uniref:C40 family peptidase n=1 Tax=Frankia sp. Mgl5 TaxID=2933793 RepID=UPI00200D3F5E|nr:bifunctional lytic transglycosylase/C40 family peptidase [Frankia sp. Mgl5]MCK9931099.1 bifunctional lytic transglycosylase/C40 family peptidase [Frankia sp. Mgl5]
MSRLFAGLCALLLAVPLLAGATAAGLLGGGIGGQTPRPSPSATADIPAGYQQLYRAAAATCPGLPWTVLAAVGKVETDHGQNPDWTSDAGAVGPMQFLAGTFTAYGVDGDGDGTADITNPADAIYSAANYLCASGARDGADISGALYAYNHDTSYVTRVLTQADLYTTPDPTSSGPSTAALTAVDYATAQIGLPYLWGGDGPDYGEKGFDCSGLSRAAYAAAGITIPRVAQDQFDAGPRLPPGTPLEIGDLVFYGTSTIDITHVGIYIGGGEMINAPRRGAPVRTETYVRPSYLGATRPAHP